MEGWEKKERVPTRVGGGEGDNDRKKGMEEFYLF